MVASLAWAWGSLYSKHRDKPAAPMLNAAMQSFAGGVVLLMAAALTGEFHGFHFAAVSTRSWLALLYLIAFGSGIGFSAYVFLLEKSTPARVGTYAFVNPVVALFLGWLIAAEPNAAYYSCCRRHSHGGDSGNYRAASNASARQGAVCRLPVKRDCAGISPIRLFHFGRPFRIDLFFGLRYFWLVQHGRNANKYEAGNFRARSRALLASDASARFEADGTFVLAVRSTHIIADHRARRAARCDGTWFSSTRGKRLRSRGTGRACAAGERNSWSRRAGRARSAPSCELHGRKCPPRRAGQHSQYHARHTASRVPAGDGTTTARACGSAANQEIQSDAALGQKTLPMRCMNWIRVIEPRLRRSNAQLGMTPATYRKGGKGMRIGYTVVKSRRAKFWWRPRSAGVSAVYFGDAESALIAELREEYPRAEIAPARDSYQKWVRKLCSGSKARSRGWNFRSTCRRPRFSGASGRSCSGFPGAGPARTRRWRGRSGSRKRCAQWRALARRTRFPSWCRATG